MKSVFLRIFYLFFGIGIFSSLLYMAQIVQATNNVSNIFLTEGAQIKGVNNGGSNVDTEKENSLMKTDVLKEVEKQENYNVEEKISQKEGCKVKENYDYRKKGPAQVANALCGDREKEKKEYAEFLGIKDYKSTREQNEKILEYMVKNKKLPLKSEGSINEEENNEGVVVKKENSGNNTGEENNETKVSDGDKRNEEFMAYSWIQSQGIISETNFNDIKLRKPVTRAELAKIMSIVAIKIFGKKEDVEKYANYPDVDASLGDLEDYIYQAYRLQIMGINSDGSQLSKFSPNEFTTRAEFATVLSRILFGNKFNQEGDNWFSQHLYVLKEEKILNNNIPQEKEIKMDIVVALYRVHGLSTVTKLVQNFNHIETKDIQKEESVGNGQNEENVENDQVENLSFESTTQTTDLLSTGDKKEDLIEEGVEKIEEIETAKVDNNPLVKINYGGELIHLGFNESDYKQKLVQYAYKLGGLDFVYMIECENGNRDIHAIGDGGHAYGLCQMNDRFHKNIPSDYKENGIVQLEYCYEKRKNGTKFYGPSRIVHGTKCKNYVKDRFTFMG